MRFLSFSILAWLLSSTVALSCICDLECPEGEVYSDEAEMCVVKDAPTS